MIEETDTSGNMTRDYIFFAGRRIAWRDSSGYIHYYLADVLGSTRAVTDSSGNTCFQADKYPGACPERSRRGQEATPAGVTNTCSPAYKFTGYEYDSETGNYYAYARYYNPLLGRFMSPDPLAGDIQNPQSLNRYTYVLNNPETFIDPLGLDTSSSNCNSTAPCKVKVTATPVCYGPPTDADPFGGFGGWVPYYDKASCTLMEDQMKSGTDFLFNTDMQELVSPGLPASVYTRGLRRQAGPHRRNRTPRKTRTGGGPRPRAKALTANF